MTKELQMIVVAALIFVGITGGLGYWGMTISDDVAAKNTELDGIEASIKKNDKIIAKRKDLEIEKDKLDKHLSRYVTILPPPEVATPQTFLRLVQEKVERSQLSLQSIVFVEEKAKKGKAKRKPKGKGKASSKKKAGPAFEELRVNLEAQGSYDEYLRFLNSLERHETFLRVNSFTCAIDEDAMQDAFESGQVGGEDGQIVWKLRIEMQVSTFTYKGS